MFARSLFILLVTGSLLARAQAPAMTATNMPAANAAPIDPAVADLRDAYALLSLNPPKNDEALAKVNAAIALNPKILSAYIMRGGIYFAKEQWPACEADFNTALQMDPNNIVIKFQLAEIPFIQKNYPEARRRFSALTSHPDMGDLASYRVFLCDLAGGQEATAKKELDVFNDAGSNPSYYFSNAAWSATHGNIDDAKSWLTSAIRIYIPGKNRMYAEPLKDLGILDKIKVTPGQ